MRFFSKNKKELSKKSCEKEPEQWWYPLQLFGRGNRYGHNYLNAYKYIAPVRTVIDKRADCMGSAVPYVLDKNGNESNNTNANKLRGLFESPNFYQSFSELYILKEIYRLIFGWCVIYTPRAYKGAIPYAMYVLPPVSIDIQLKQGYNIYNQKDYSNIIEKIHLYAHAEQTEIDIDDIIIFRDSLPCSTNPLISESRMSSIFNEYDLSGAIAEAEKVLVERQGALGILSKDANEIANTGTFEDEREEIQSHYKREYGLRMNQDQIIITQTALKWQQIAMPTKDLMLIELDQEAQKKIAGVYNVPYNLLPGGYNSTFSNQLEAKKALYQETAIPVSESDAKKFTNALTAKHNLCLKLDYSDLYLFQEDMRLKAITMNQAIGALKTAVESGLMTEQEARNELSKYTDIDPNN